MKYLLSIVLFGLFLTACAPENIFGGRRHKRSTPSPAAPAPVVQKQPSACELKYKDYESGRYNLYVEKKISYPIHRIYQRVKTYTCDGKLYTDRVETIRDPRVNLTLNPENKVWLANTVRLFNLDSCEDSFGKLSLTNLRLLPFLEPITGYVSGKVYVKADTAPATFTYKVKKGLNRIYYTYYENCSSEELLNNKAAVIESCDKKGRVYTGIFNVEINYTSETLPGIKEVRLSCEPQTARTSSGS